MKKYLFVLLFLILPAISHAQGVYYRDVAFTLRNGVLVPAVNARITICDAPASGTPCTPTADIFSNEALTVAKANPIVTTALGAYDFYAAPGTYYYTVTGLGLNSQGPIRIDLGGGGGVNGMDGVGATSTITNASSVGTIVNKIAKLTGAPSRALVVATSDTGGAIGIVTAGAGVTGNATIQHMGVVSCVFDGATTAGNYVQISSAVTGNCDDVGSTYPTSGQIIGRILSTNGSGGTYNIDLFPPELRGAGTGSGVTPEDCAPDFVSAISVGGIITCTPVGSGADILPLDNTFLAPNRFKSYVPWSDLTAWPGGRQIANGFPYSATTTCVSGSPNITLATAGGGTSLWVNGDGITIHGCGPATGLGTPTAPTVVPSNAAGGTMTGAVVPGNTGSSTYLYRIVARTKQGGLSAPSAATTITNGRASIGLQGPATITTMTRLNAEVTVTTSAATQIVVGTYVHIKDGSSSQFSGWFIVSAVNSATEFEIANTAIDSRGLGGEADDTTSSTGGELYYYLSNHLTWPILANAWEYYVCAQRPGDGGYAIIGVTKPSGTTYFDTQYDDFGDAFHTGQTFPYYITNAICTGSARPNPLTTTIVSGAGTVNLVLAANAGSNSSTLPAIFDNAPALLAAANYMSGGGVSGGPVLIPAGIQSGSNYSTMISSYLALPINTTLLQAGPITLLETFELGAFSNWTGEWNTVGQPAFASSSGAAVTGMYGVNPMIYLPGDGTYMSHLNISNVATNGGTMIVTDDIEWQVMDNLNLVGADNQTTDRMSMAIVNRVGGTFGGNWYNYNKILFSGGPGAQSHTSWTPLVFFAPSQNGIGSYYAHFNDTSWNRRGFESHHPGGGASFQFDWTYRQGGITPMFTQKNTSGLIASTLVFNWGAQDSEVQPMIALLGDGLGSTVGANINIVGWKNNGSELGGITPPFSGDAPLIAKIETSYLGRVPTRNSTASQPSFAVTYPYDTSGTFPFSIQSLFSVTQPLHIPSGHSMFWDLSRPVNVNTSLVAGGSLTSGTQYYYAVSATGADGAETVPSITPDTSTPSGGNLTVRTTWNSLPGATSYNVYRCNETTETCVWPDGRISVDNGVYHKVGTHVVDVVPDGGVVTFDDTGFSNGVTPPATTGTGIALANPTGFYGLKFGLITPPNGSGVSSLASLKSIATSNGDVIFPDLAGTPSLFSPASIAAWAQPRCVRTGTTPGELLIAAEDCGSGGGGSGTVTSVGLVGTANQLTVTGSSPITNSGSWTLSIPTNPTLPGTTTGTFLGNLTGNSTTTTALAANGTNCDPGNYARGVDASGNAENCTAAAGSGDALVANPLSQFAPTTSAQLASVLSNETGTGVAAFSISPVFTTPNIAVATATSINKVAITAPATNATLTIANGKTLTASNTLTLTGTDASSVSFGAGGTVGYKIAEGNAALGTSAIASAACATVVTGTATGASASTDNLMADFNANPTGVTGYTPSASGMLSIIKFITTNTANFVVCNNTASSITPGAITLRWKVIR